MSEFSYTHDCGNCGATLMTINNADAAAWQALVTRQPHVATCPHCGSRYAIEADGDGLIAVDKSRPGISTIVPERGTVLGGTRVRVNGSRFTTSPPNVRFGSAVGLNVNVISDTALDVDAPAGSLRVVLDDHYVQLSHVNASGSFQNGEVITGSTSSAQGTIKALGADYLLVETTTGAFVGGEHITGAASSTTAIVTNVALRQFHLGETLQGVASGNTAVVTSVSPLRVGSTTSGGFSNGEEVFGITSNARAKLGSPWYDGLVDVTLDNEHGERDSGGRLQLSYEFIP